MATPANVAKKSAEPRGYKGWFGTSWLPETLPHDEASAKNFIESKLASATHYAAQVECCPTTGRYHFQWAARWYSQKRMSTIKDLLGEGHYDRLGAEVDAVKYCTKTETRVWGPWVKGWCVPEKVTCMVCDKGPLPWQAEFIAELSAPPDDRQVIWIWDEKGHQGKSKLLKHLGMCLQWQLVGGATQDCFFAIKNRLYPEKGTGKPFKGLIFDYSRPDADASHFNYTVMEKAKDGMIFNAKYESGAIYFNTVHVVVAANILPDMTKLTSDRWDVRQLKNGVLTKYTPVWPIFQSHASHL